MLLLAALKDKSAPFCGFQVEDGIGLEAGADHIEWGSEGRELVAAISSPLSMA